MTSYGWQVEQTTLAAAQCVADFTSNGPSASSILTSARLLYEVPVNEAACIVRGSLVAEGSPLCMVEASNAVYDLSQRVLHHNSHTFD